MVIYGENFEIKENKVLHRCFISNILLGFMHANVLLKSS